MKKSSQIELLEIDSLQSIQQEMKKIGVTQEGIALMSTKYIFLVIKLHQIRNASANILKQEMLSLGGEAAVHKYTVNCKVSETDVLLAGTLKIYLKLISKLKSQVLDLKQIALDLEEIIKKQKI